MGRAVSGAPVAVALRCPNCGGDFAGFDADRVWTCASCRAAWEVEDGALAPRRFVEYAAPFDGDVLRLPFWRIGYDPVIECAEAEPAQAVARATSLRRAWVRSFRLDGAWVVGDPGQALTSLEFDEIESDRPPRPCPGGVIGSADAMRLASLYVLAAADRIADITPVKFELVPTSLEYVALPFRVLGDSIESPWIQRRHLLRALPDFGRAAR